MIKLALTALAPLLLAGCVTYHVRGDGIARAGLGETVGVDGPRVTPLEVLEDSRCPMNARCVWAGQVRLKVRVHLGAGDVERELTSNKLVPVADGTLELVEVRPDRVAGETLDPKNYRFGFKFMGGL
ncbi:MAG: hypothetical protein JWQ16_2983 [Novosphingobium sp.]|nr:hypothetical protein [Novosphingobium sp.]